MMQKLAQTLLACMFLALSHGVLAVEIDFPKQQNMTAQQRAQWFNVLHWDDSCESDFREAQRDDNFGGLSFWPLAPQKYLIEAQCMQGPYQASYIYLYYDESAKKPTARQLSFQTLEKVDGKIQESSVPELAQAYSETDKEYSHFNTQTKELTVVTKYRGLNDCGHFAVYKINEDGTVQLKIFKAKFTCDAKPLKYKTYLPNVNYEFR